MILGVKETFGRTGKEQCPIAGRVCPHTVDKTGHPENTKPIPEAMASWMVANTHPGSQREEDKVFLDLEDPNLGIKITGLSLFAASNAKWQTICEACRNLTRECLQLDERDITS